jgi:hypothetical protein
VLLLGLAGCATAPASSFEACRSWVDAELDCFREAGVAPEGHVPADQIEGTYCRSLYGDDDVSTGAPFHEELVCYRAFWRRADCADPQLDLRWADAYGRCLADRDGDTDTDGG